MVEIFWIANQEKYSNLRNALEKGTREAIRVITIDKLIELKEDLPSYSILCFEVNSEFYNFLQKYELSLDDQLVVPICSEADAENLVNVASQLSNPNRFHLTLNSEFNTSLLVQSFRTLVKLAELSRGAREFSQVGKNINKLVSASLHEVDRLRKLHERIVSLRSESIKGLKVTSKFAAGEAPGGEFFDMVVGDGQMLIMLTSSSSYVVTSVLLTHIDMLRSLKKFEPKDIKNYIQVVTNDLNTGDGITPVEALFLVIDNKNLKMEVYSYGGSIILGEEKILISGNEHFLEVDSFDMVKQTIQLERDKKFMILSPGLMKMTVGIVNNMPVMDFYKNQYSKNGAEILNELFFHLKKNSQGNFLKRDASSLVIEVGSNVMVQV